MAAISPILYEGAPNHLEYYYLYSPLKKLKDERVIKFEPI